MGEIKAGNAGLVTTTVVAVGNLCHTIPLGRTVIIRKILAYNPGVLATLQFGSWNNAVPPAFVQYLPELVAIGGPMDSEWTTVELPAVEFVLNTLVAPNGRSGSIYVLASLANLLIQIEVEEIGLTR